MMTDITTITLNELWQMMLLLRALSAALELSAINLSLLHAW